MRHQSLSFILCYCSSLFFFASNTCTINFPLLDSFLAIFQNKIIMHDVFLKMKRLTWKGVNGWERMEGKVGRVLWSVLTMSVKAREIWWPFKPSAPDRRSKRVMRQTEEKLLPSLRYKPIVHGFYSQSVAPPNLEFHTWCHSNDPTAVKTVHSVLHDHSNC